MQSQRGGRFDRWLGSGARAIVNELVVIGSGIVLVVAVMKLVSAHASGPLSFLSDIEWEWYVVVLSLTTGATALTFEKRRTREARPDGTMVSGLLESRVGQVENNLVRIEQEVVNLAFAKATKPDMPVEVDQVDKLPGLAVEGELLLARCPQWTHEDSPDAMVRRLYDEWMWRIEQALPERPQIVEILQSPIPYDENENELYRQIVRAIEALTRLSPRERRYDPDGNEL